MRLRGVNINCELMREAQLYSQLHGEPQRELTSQVTLSARRDLTRQLKVNEMKKKMQPRPRRPMQKCNVIPINLEPHTRLCLVTQSTEIQVLGMAKKKKIYFLDPAQILYHDFYWAQLRYFIILGQSRPTAGKAQTGRRARLQFCGILNRWAK